MSSKFDSMGKDELRKACKEAGVPYGKLNNDGMRAALKAKEAESKKEQFPENDSRKTPEDFGIPSTPKATEAPAPAPTPVVNVPPRAPSEASVSAELKKTGKTAGMKIEKDREEKNGVKRPSAGGMCRQVWDALDAIKATGKMPTAKDVKDLSIAKHWNPNNASIEYYQWRKFNGITGRAKAE